MQVLIVDDEPSIRDLFSFYLSRAGFEVSVGADGEEALDLLVTAKYDLAILDALLPRMHGLKVLARLRESEPRDRRTPVIIVTGVLTWDVYRKEAMRLGADGFLTKPIDMDELVAAARRLTEIHATAG